MNPPEFFELAEGYAVYKPVAEVTLLQTVDLLSAAIVFCREQGIRKLLADITRLTGFGPPSIAQRFMLAERCAAAAQSRVMGAMVARPEMIDPNRFGVTVARNRGLITNVFTSEAEAIQWLTEGEGA